MATQERPMDQSDINKMMLKIAQDEAREWIEGLAQHHERYAKSLREYIERFNHAIENVNGTISSPTDIIGHVVNEVNNCQRNCRLDMAVSIATKIAQYSLNIE